LGNWLKIGVLVAICLIPLFIVPAFAPSHPEYVGVGFYENELYEFSFNAPTNWKYQENVQFPNVPMFLVVIFPEEFSSPSSLTGFQFYINTPNVGVQYEYVPQSKVPTLNGKAIENYISEQIRLVLPNGKIFSSSVESRSWGWLVTTKYFLNLDLGFHEPITIFVEEKSYFFKDRDVYLVSYGAIDEYYDNYYFVFENVIDTLVIKGVVVPEFQEIAMMVLASSIILVVVFARKYKVMKNS